MIKNKNDFPFYSLIKNSLLFIMDGLSYIISMYLALKIRHIMPVFFDQIDFPGFSVAPYFFPETFILLFIIYVVFIWNHLYQVRRTFWQELLIIWQSLIVACLICYLFIFNFNVLPFLSRIVILLLFLILAVMIPLFRAVLKYILFRLSIWKTPVIFFCKESDLSKSVEIAEHFEKNFYFGFVPVGFYIENYPKKEILLGQFSLPIYESKENLPDNIIVFAVEDVLDNELKIYLYSRYRHLYLASYKNIIGCTGQYFFKDRLFVRKLENMLNSHVSQLVKSSMDFIGGFLLILLFSPLFVLIALIIKITSKGTVFYKQKRIGKYGKEFYIWKFRTMYLDADQKLKDLLNSNPDLKKEWQEYLKLKNDPRITKVGKFLRKYSLDEFPQLFNVLLGEMSLVGPRPFVKGEIEEINPHLLPIFAQVKPGLTGLWQISGRNNIDKVGRADIDVWYIQNWSIGFDLLILLNTPFVVFSGKGAS